MAKKKNVNNEPPKKSLNEMSDSEFITYADYLSSPYYRAYVNARIRAEQGGSSSGYAGGGYAGPSYGGGFTGQSYTGGYPTAGYPTQRATGPVPKNRRQKKRGFFLFLILLLMIVTIAIAVLPLLNMAMIEPYASVYKLPNGKEIEVVDPETEAVSVEKADAFIGLPDPIIGLVKTFMADFSMDSEYYTNFVEGKLDDAAPLVKVALYAVPSAAILIVVCAVIGLIKALVALFSRKKSDGYYKKIGFGFLAILMFLCGLLLAVGGLYFSGVGIDGAVDFLTFKSETIQACYGLYALVALPILIFIFSCVSYKKIKK